MRFPLLSPVAGRHVGQTLICRLTRPSANQQCRSLSVSVSNRATDYDVSSIPGVTYAIRSDTKTADDKLVYEWLPHRKFEFPRTIDFNSLYRDDLFAIVQMGHAQFKVTKGDLVLVNKVTNAQVQDDIVLQKVLAVGGKKFLLMGRPIVTTAIVRASVEEHLVAKHIINFQLRRRKNSRRTRSSRPHMTALRIEDIALTFTPSAEFVQSLPSPQDYIEKENELTEQYIQQRGAQVVLPSS